MEADPYPSWVSLCMAPARGAAAAVVAGAACDALSEVPSVAAKQPAEAAAGAGIEADSSCGELTAGDGSRPSAAIGAPVDAGVTCGGAGDGAGSGAGSPQCDARAAARPPPQSPAPKPELTPPAPRAAIEPTAPLPPPLRPLAGLAALEKQDGALKLAALDAHRGSRHRGSRQLGSSSWPLVALMPTGRACEATSAATMAG